MTLKWLLAAPAAAGLFLAAPAHARDEGSDFTYTGIGLYRLHSDFKNLKDAVSLGAVLGLHVPKVNWIAAELELMSTVIPGENKGPAPLLGGGGGGNCITDNPPTPPGCMPAGSGGGSQGKETSSSDDLQVQTITAFLALRSPGRFYATGRVGYRYLISTIPELDDDRNGVAFSAGGGWHYRRSGIGGVEILFTRYSSDINTLGLQITYGFGG